MFPASLLASAEARLRPLGVRRVAHKAGLQIVKPAELVSRVLAAPSHELSADVRNDLRWYFEIHTSVLGAREIHQIGGLGG